MKKPKAIVNPVKLNQQPSDSEPATTTKPYYVAFPSPPKSTEKRKVRNRFGKFGSKSEAKIPKSEMPVFGIYQKTVKWLHAT